MNFLIKYSRHTSLKLVQIKAATTKPLHLKVCCIEVWVIFLKQSPLTILEICKHVVAKAAVGSKL